MKTNEEMFHQLDEYMKDQTRDDLFGVLCQAQRIFGYLPFKVQQFVADHFDLNLSEVFAVVSGCDRFSLLPKGANVVNVCLGTACYVKGAAKVLEKCEEVLKIKNGETTPDGKFTLTTLRCVGKCSLAPVVQINDRIYGNVKAEEIEDILNQH